LDIKIGKMIFYAPVALGLWFFYLTASNALAKESSTESMTS